MNENVSQAKDLGYEQLQKLLNEANDLLSDGESFVGDKADAARKKLEGILDKANSVIPKNAEEAVEKGKEALGTAANHVKEKPWHTAAIISGLAVGLWLLLRR
ncbi:DUF883 family protein [Pseudomonas typographi]|uniref:DUF883 family protein n=1 Tax=Pseudomonas typographi TaxID=2715964 RepID=A0ABR7Z5X8_9PSED|nr:DUF883 family protein [Pseudomonas typographi]MBD1600870.1 DUF883 family protein [Pseudomonas typographi]